GYDIVRRLRAAGLHDVGDASVYGTLRRLFQAGALTAYVVPSEEGPHRKYYSLNAPGRDRLSTTAKTWRAFAETMDQLIGDAA
ncbi:MAG: PadR family transcriptional regulator, partial [Mycobacteriaceae bacterium]